MTKIEIQWNNKSVGLETTYRNIIKRSECILLAQELVIRMDIKFIRRNYITIYKGIKKSYSMAKESNGIGKQKIYLPQFEAEVTVDCSDRATINPAELQLPIYQRKKM